MNVIFDSNVYELADCQIGDLKAEFEHFDYFSYLIDFIKPNRHNHKIICSFEEFQAISNLQDHPWNQYNDNVDTKNVIQYNAIVMLFCTFLELIDYNELKTNDTVPAIPLSFINYCSLNEKLCYIEFLKHISKLKESKDCIVFMGTANHQLSTPLQFEVGEIILDIEPIMNINDENIINFSNGYRNWLMANDYIQPSLANPLPNKDWCKNYQSIQKDLIDNGQDKIGTYRKIVKEVALRNGYIRDERVSKLNSNSGNIRDIYTTQNSPIIYISADIRHGRIEVFNYLGKHQGEYSYTGDYFPNTIDKLGNHDIDV